MPDSLSERPSRPARWRAAGSSFGFEGNDIFYHDSGARPAPTLLLLHGFPTSSFDWHYLREPLVRRFRVVAADMLGFGFSAKPRRAQYSILKQADLFEALARHLSIEAVHLLAHDYGDTVAQELLARNREGLPRLRILSACLLNGGLFPEMHRPLLIQKLLASKLGPLVARFSTRRSFLRRFSSIFGPNTKPTNEELEEYWTIINERAGQLLFPKLIGYMDERRRNRERWVGALQEPGIPVRFIDGLADPISGGHMVARYRELIPVADVVELPGIGHYPQHEAPEQVLRAVLEFHDRIGS